MLTRRLYRFDEVRASFLYCIRQRRLPEVLFWLEELEDSLYSNEARRLLFVGWFLFVGLKRLKWLEAWSLGGHTREGRYTLTWQLVRCSERDSSLPWLLWAGVVVDPVTPAHGRLLQGWRALWPLEESECWQEIVNGIEDERLEPCLEALQTDLRVYARLGQLTAYALGASQNSLPSSTWSALSTQPPSDDRASWKVGSLRDQRVFPIPQDALFGMCWRGRGADTRSELQSLGKEQFQSSPFWKTVLPEDTDEGQEAFWDTYFPWMTCDHPDEWSLADRAKSHGEGTGVHGGSAPLWRWWKSWIGQERIFVWGKEAHAVKLWVDDQRADTSSWVLESVLELYKTSELSAIPRMKCKKVFSLVLTSKTAE